jgi:hypothetical protein
VRLDEVYQTGACPASAWWRHKSVWAARLRDPTFKELYEDNKDNDQLQKRVEEVGVGEVRDGTFPLSASIPTLIRRSRLVGASMLTDKSPSRMSAGLLVPNGVLGDYPWSEFRSLMLKAREQENPDGGFAAWAAPSSG